MADLTVVSQLMALAKNKRHDEVKPNTAPPGFNIWSINGKHIFVFLYAHTGERHFAATLQVDAERIQSAVQVVPGGRSPV
jgi:hypothetical protein